LALPSLVLQTWVSFKEGFWVAREASFFMKPFVQFIGTVRVIPDLTIILLGVLPCLFSCSRPTRVSRQPKSRKESRCGSGWEWNCDAI